MLLIWLKISWRFLSWWLSVNSHCLPGSFSSTALLLLHPWAASYIRVVFILFWRPPPPPPPPLPLLLSGRPDQPHRQQPQQAGGGLRSGQAQTKTIKGKLSWRKSLWINNGLAHCPTPFVLSLNGLESDKIS